MKLFARLLARFRRPAPAPAVLGVTPSAPKPTPKGAPVATLAFRGFEWVQRGDADEKGRITFARQVAVDGRVAETEVTVMARDLTQLADGTYTLGGRA